jgi:hypothetical protein
MAHAHFVLDTSGYKQTHSGCVILNAFPLQQWLHERASMLRYMYIACHADNEPVSPRIHSLPVYRHQNVIT